MPILSDWKERLRRNWEEVTHVVHYALSFFFYQLVKFFVFSKIKSHGRIVTFTYDFFAVILAWISAYWMLIDTMADISNPLPDKITNSVFLITSYWKPVLWYLFWILPPQIFLFIAFGLYRGFWRFASIQDIRKILYVSMLGGLMAWCVLRTTTGSTLLSKVIFSPYSNLEQLALLPRYGVAVLYTTFLIAFLSSGRLFVRMMKNYNRLYENYKRVIIVGAGNAGEGLVRDLLRGKSHRYKPILFVDDDKRKINREIHGIRVMGALDELSMLIKKYSIDLVLIAIPSAPSVQIRKVVASCEKVDVDCFTLPSLKDLANGRVSINTLRSISLEDLLGRYPITCQWSFIKSNLKGKTILITGGGGSIGSELCRQLAELKVIEQLIIVDSNEYNLYAIEMELKQHFPSCSLHFVLLSVTDRTGLRRIFEQFSPNFVFHAAAYKHVPILEYQPRIAVYNNVIGTCIVAEEASRAKVETFILISTDKAVNPTNIMGTTKRAAEYFCQNLNSHVSTKFITVRFGNVLDSAGSVVPLFRKQIEAGGPVTVTHPEVTRFFMTIPEAAQLILQAVFLGQGGEIFVLDMGEPVKISYLAEQMIKLAGKIPQQDIKITYTGLRPGEKLYEEYFYPNEVLQPTPHAKILRAKSQWRDFKEISLICKELESACLSEDIANNKFIEILRKLVPEYQARDDSNEKLNIAAMMKQKDSNQFVSE